MVFRQRALSKVYQLIESDPVVLLGHYNLFMLEVVQAWGDNPPLWAQSLLVARRPPGWPLTAS
jgi:hypothetical protein